MRQACDLLVEERLDHGRLCSSTLIRQASARFSSSAFWSRAIGDLESSFQRRYPERRRATRLSDRRSFASSHVTSWPRSSPTRFSRRLADEQLSDLVPSSRCHENDLDLVFLILPQADRSPASASMSRVRSSFSTPFRRENTCAPMTVPETPGGTRSEVSRTSPGLLAEDRTQAAALPERAASRPSA